MSFIVIPRTLQREGFEPPNRKGTDLKSVAVDRLANVAECSLWDLNPRPWCYKHHALTNCAKRVCETCEIRTREAFARVFLRGTPAVDHLANVSYIGSFNVILQDIAT